MLIALVVVLFFLLSTAGKALFNFASSPVVISTFAGVYMEDGIIFFFLRAM